MAPWYVDFSAGSNGAGTSAGSPFNNIASLVSAAPAAGDVVYCTGTLNGTLALSTLAGSSLANTINFEGVTNLSTLDKSSRTLINASGQSAALTGSGGNLRFFNFDFRNSTGTTHQASGSNLQFINCVFHKGTGSAASALNAFDQYIRGCQFYNYTGTAVTTAGVSGSVFEDNLISGCAAGLSASGYRSLVIRGNVFVSITGNALTMPNNAVPGTAYAIHTNTFYGIGGDAITFGGSGNGEVMVCFNLFGSVTGTAINISGSVSSTTIGAHTNNFWSIGTNLGANVKNLGSNVTLGSSPFTSPPSDVTVTSGSGLRGTWFNGSSFGAQQIGAGGGGGGGYIGHALLGGEL